MQVIVQRWIESEHGWGTRSDGLSIHFSLEQRKEYIDRYWDRLKQIYGPNVPFEYSRPESGPIEMTIITEGADEFVLRNVLAGTSFRVWDDNPAWLRKKLK